MQEAIDRFMYTLRAQAASPNTIKGYREDLEYLSRFVGVQQQASCLTHTIVRAHLAFLMRHGMAPASIRRKLAAIKMFSRWLHLEELLDGDTYDTIRKLRGPKLPTILPDIPNVEDITRLLEGEFPTAFPQRDRLILELLYGAGLRVNEAAKLTLQDFRPEQRAIRIHGKGGMYGKAAKERLVPTNPYIQAALDAYLPARERFIREQNIDSDSLFIAVRNRYHEKGTRPAISDRSVRRVLLFMCELRGLQPMWPHLLRHACATHLLDNGCPLDVIKEILGHDNLDITAHYAQVSTRTMLNAYNSAHPHSSSAC